MRKIILACSVLTATCFLSGHPGRSNRYQLDSNDTYGYGLVMSAFEQCKNGGSFSTIFTAITLLGDQVTIALVKQLDADAMVSPQNIRAYLRLVRVAFKYPDKIVKNENRNPNVTLLLLSYLQMEEEHDLELEKEIESTKRYVEDQVGMELSPIH
jgi:hypothetical protein